MKTIIKIAGFIIGLLSVVVAACFWAGYFTSLVKSGMESEINWLCVFAAWVLSTPFVTAFIAFAMLAFKKD